MTLFCKKQKKKSFTWMLSLMTLCLVLFGTCLFTTPVFATPEDTAEAETVGDIYDVSTALTAYVNNVVGANGNDKHNNQRVENPGSIGNAGAYVGYGDEKQGFVSFITSNTTIGSSASTYDAWEDILDGGNTNAVYGYVRFGKALADAGFDETMTADNTFNWVRIVTGAISMVVFVAGEIVPTIFGFALSILQMFNVFSFFGRSTFWVASYWKNAFPDAPNFLDPLVNTFSRWYSLLANLSIMVVVPILFAIVAMNILLLRQKAGGQLTKLAKRLVFIVIGLPLMAGAYTVSLDSLAVSVGDHSASARLVAASFVDFSAWVDKGLSIPSGVHIDSSCKEEDGSVNAGGHLSTKASLELRNSALLLNQANNSVLKKAGWSSIDGSEHGLVSGGLWNTNGGLEKGSKTPEGVKRELFDMLNRYMFGEQYTSGAYATKITSNFPGASMGSSSEEDKDRKDTVRQMLNDTDSVDDWMRREKEDNLRIWRKTGGGELPWTSKDFNMFTGGHLNASGDYGDNGVLVYSASGDGLSPMAMYNYLSTSFKESSVISYSNATSVSEHVKQAHMSVTSIGNGALGFLFMLNMWVCIGVVALIGCYFALGMTLKNLKTSLHLLTAIPLAVMGVLKSIAQAIMYCFMMIAQLFVGAFMYTVVSEILMVLATVVEHLAADGLGGASGGTVSIVPSFLAAIGVPNITVPTAMVGAVLLGEILLVCGMGAFVWKYRRACVRGYNYSLTWCMRQVTLPEFQELFESVWVRKEKPVFTGSPVGEFGDVLAYLMMPNNYQYREEVC